MRLTVRQNPVVFRSALGQIDAQSRITLLPHIAALTDERSAALVVVANLRALRDGGRVAYLVDRARGY